MGSKKKAKLTIGFWAANNNFTFLDEIIEKLKKDFCVKKFLAGGNLKEELSLVDVAWFEWANGAIIEVSNFQNIKIPVICRLHKYEVYTDVIRKINWKNITKLIFISESVRETFRERFPNELKKVENIIIRNGIDLSIYRADLNRPWGKKIAFNGHLNYHKNPSLLLQAFYSIHKMDNQFKLFLVGTFPDPVLEEYFWDQAKKLKIANAIIHEGYRDDVNDWLKDKDFFLLPSIIEGQSVASLEAMACGLKPLIHNYTNAELLYPKKYLFSNIEELLEAVSSEDKDRCEYRAIIEKENNLETQVEKIEKLISSISNHTIDKNNGSANSPKKIPRVVKFFSSKFRQKND